MSTRPPASAATPPSRVRLTPSGRAARTVSGGPPPFLPSKTTSASLPTATSTTPAPRPHSGGADTDAVSADVEAITDTYPGLGVHDKTGYEQELSQGLDTLLGTVAVLLLLAIVVAVLGVVNTLTLSVTERMREIGLLRAVGMTGRQARRMVRWEAVTIGLMGAGLGVVVGSYLGWSMVHALADDGFHDLTFPVARLALFLVAGVLVGVLAAVAPARKAARADVLEAVAST